MSDSSVTPWTESVQFSRQGYWSGLSFPFSDLSDPGIKPTSPVSPALAGRVFSTEPQERQPVHICLQMYGLGERALSVCVCVCVCVCYSMKSQRGFVSLCGRTSVFPLAYGFHMVNMCLTSQETAHCFLTQLWLLLIISVASEFPVSPCSHPSSDLHVTFSVFLC